MPKVLLKPKPNFDLLPKNPRPLFLKLESTKVNVEIEIETKSPNSAKTDRWTQVAEVEMARYRDIVEDTVAKVTAPWEKAGTPVSQRMKEAQVLTHAVNNAYRSMEGAIEKVVREQIKREAQGDKNLLEARIAVAAKGTFKIVAIGKDVAEIVVTGGANVKAWYGLAKDIVALAKIVADQCKGEPKLRDDLLRSIGDYCSTKQRRFNEASKAKDWSAKAKLWIKTQWTTQKSLAAKCEAQRKKYRNEVTVLIGKVDAIGKKHDTLLADMRKSGRIDTTGIAKGAKMAALGASLNPLNSRILECQTFTDAMAVLLTEMGFTIDDSTAMQKLAKLRGLGSIKDAAQGIYAAATDLQETIAAIKA